MGTAADGEGLAGKAEAAAGSGRGDPGSLPSKEPFGSVMTKLNKNIIIYININIITHIAHYTSQREINLDFSS